VLLIGALPQPITAAPLVFFVYLVLLLLLGSALASVLLRNTLYGIGAFAASMVLVALLYLAIAPFLLVAVQLLVFTTVSAALLIGLLRDTTGLRASGVGRLSREWIIGAAVSAVMFALLAVVLGATAWPVQVCCARSESLGSALANMYVVGLAVLAVILGSAALGSGLMLMAPTLPSPRGGGSTSSRSSGGGGSRTAPTLPGGGERSGRR
jgi:NADH:ubiquinone oxidoreductase subunit 6 (subunit J)